MAKVKSFQKSKALKSQKSKVKSQKSKVLTKVLSRKIWGVGDFGYDCALMAVS